MCGKVIYSTMELYRSQTARVNAPVQPLITSGPQFHLLVRGANPEPVRVRTGPGSWPIRDLCRHTVRQKQVHQYSAACRRK